MGDPTSPWTVKPVQMLQQEAAVTLALGGALQIYEPGGAARNGQMADWRVKRVSQLGKFVKARQALCQDTETIAQVAVLHSEHQQPPAYGPQPDVGCGYQCSARCGVQCIGKPL